MPADDELIIRLRAEADTAALKRAVKELEDMQREGVHLQRAAAHQGPIVGKN